MTQEEYDALPLGTPVRILSQQELLNMGCENRWLATSMMKYCGKETIITSRHESRDNCCYLGITGSNYYWGIEALEIVLTSPISADSFKKIMA